MHSLGLGRWGKRGKYPSLNTERISKTFTRQQPGVFAVRLDGFGWGGVLPILFQDFQLQQSRAGGWAVRRRGLLVSSVAFVYFPWDSSGVLERWLFLFVPLNWMKQLSLRLAPAGQHKEGQKSGLKLDFAMDFWSSGFVLLHLYKLFGPFQYLDMSQRGS